MVIVIKKLDNTNSYAHRTDLLKTRDAFESLYKIMIVCSKTL